MGLGYSGIQSERKVRGQNLQRDSTSKGADRVPLLCRYADFICTMRRALIINSFYVSQIYIHLSYRTASNVDFGGSSELRHWGVPRQQMTKDVPSVIGFKLIFTPHKMIRRPE